MRTLSLLAIVLLSAFPASASSLSGKYKDYNVLLITMTNLGANHMSLYGYGRQTTPKLDDWAKATTVFDNAFGHA